MSLPTPCLSSTRCHELDSLVRCCVSICPLVYLVFLDSVVPMIEINRSILLIPMSSALHATSNFEQTGEGMQEHISQLPSVYRVSGTVLFVTPSCLVILLSEIRLMKWMFPLASFCKEGN